MCLYSAEAGVGRRAKVGETLTMGTYARHSCFLTDNGEVACIKPGTTVDITVELRTPHSIYVSDGKVSQPNGKGLRWTPFSKVMKWNGETVRATFVEWIEGHAKQGYTADGIKMPDGTVIHMNWLSLNTTMVIPRKQRKDKGVRKPRNLEKVLGLDQPNTDITPETETVTGA